MDLRLQDKVVLITGASGGIGQALARAFAEEGARLVLHSHRRLDELRAWAETELAADRVACVQADVRDVESVERMFATAVERFGRIDVAIANAGAWPPGDLRLDQLDPGRILNTVAINLLGATWTARAFLRSLAESGPREDEEGACLLMIGSTAGRFGERGHADYSLAKAGLVGLLQTLKNEIVQLDPYGRVNLIEPGWTVTHMARPALDVDANVVGAVRTMALRQLARAKDIAATAVMLASPATSRHVTGQAVTVAGGMEGRVLWEPDQIDVDAIRERYRDARE